MLYIDLYIHICVCIFIVVGLNGYVPIQFNLSLEDKFELKFLALIYFRLLSPRGYIFVHYNYIYVVINKI